MKTARANQHADLEPRTLWSFYIAMEDGQFIDDFRTKHHNCLYVIYLSIYLAS